MVESQPSKLLVAGSIPVSRSMKGRPKADVAQLAERVLGKDEVTSSILVIGSIRLRARENSSALRRDAAPEPLSGGGGQTSLAGFADELRLGKRASEYGQQAKMDEPARLARGAKVGPERPVLGDNKKFHWDPADEPED